MDKEQVEEMTNGEAVAFLECESCKSTWATVEPGKTLIGMDILPGKVYHTKVCPECTSIEIEEIRLTEAQTYAKTHCNFCEKLTPVAHNTLNSLVQSTRKRLLAQIKSGTINKKFKALASLVTCMSLSEANLFSLKNKFVWIYRNKKKNYVMVIND